MSEPNSDNDLVETPLFCTSCKKNHTIALPADAILRKELASLACPSCRNVGTLCLARPKKPKPERTD